MRTANGDYITAENLPAWTDYSDEDDDVLNETALVIDFDGDRAILPYNVKLDHSWEKDFERTRYLGGSITGDWNEGITRDLSVSTDTIRIQDHELIQTMRRLYAKETSASEWTKLPQTISPETASFSGASCTVSLSIDYAWDIYGVLEDGYTQAVSAKARIYSKSYIMDIRTDGTGVAFGGTAANSDELYCGFKNLRANNISPSDISGIANLIYPVGSVYISVNETSPANLFGGTWEQISGRFLLAAGGGYSAGDTGGEAFHTLNVSEIPSHQHSGSTDSDGSHSHSYGSGKYVHLTTDGDTGAEGYSGGLSGSGYKLPRSKSSENYTHGSKTASAGSHTHSFTTGSAGGGVSHNNMPPYLVVNVWKRTA